MVKSDFKVFLSFFLVLFFLSCVFGVENYYYQYDSNGVPWGYELYEADSTYVNIISPIVLKNITYNTGIGDVRYNVTPATYGRFFMYPLTSEDYVLKKGGVDLSYAGAPSLSNPISSPFQKYNTTTELALGNCNPTNLLLNCNSVSCTISFISNINPLAGGGLPITYNGNELHTVVSPVENLLRNYYYMKTKISAQLYKDGHPMPASTFNTHYPTNVIQTTPSSVANYNYENYVLLEPETNEFAFNLPSKEEIIGQYGVGYYQWKFTIKPIDLKCDFNQDNTITYGTGQEAIESNSFVDITQPPGLQIIGNIISANDGVTNKVIFDYTSNTTYYKNTVITLPNTQNTKSIEVYKNNIFKRNDTIDAKMIVLNLHNIENLKEPIQVERDLQNSFELTNRLNIKKYIDNTTNPGHTRIKLKINIPLTTDRKNLTIYQILPKNTLNNFNNLNVINDSNATEYFVLDQDPVIGWYFNESNEDEEIEYEIPGESEGGIFIVTQEPVLFNEGNLIIKYRETNCNPNEALLFELDDLVDSKVYTPNSGRKYKVCISHLTETLKADPTGHTKIRIFDYKQADNMSYDHSLPKKVWISTNTASDLFWDIKIQKDNPNGHYSCLGSIVSQDSSLFGDCDFTENRIWIQLDGDSIAPITTLSYPYVAHSMEIRLDATDLPTGGIVASTKYKIENGGWQTYNNPFTITCDENWGCVKEISFYSVDNKGNEEEHKTEAITLIDKGSACQIDCTAKPKPNRYLKECRNLNGCEYYKYDGAGTFDDGEYVAEQCHYKTIGSWVEFNSTHEVLCPIGPTRLKMFTIEKLFYDSNNCDSMQVVPYAVMIDGQTVTMNIIYCKNN